MSAPRNAALGRPRVLVVDDEEDVRLGLRLLVEPLADEVRDAESGERALEVLAGWTPHVILSDLAMGEVSGMDLLDHVHGRLPGVRVVLVTGFGTIELAVEAMRRGAAHFVTKPFDNAEIKAEVERQGREALVAERVRQMSVAGKETEIVARDRRMTEVLDLVRQVGPTTMPVLIRGESGSGKELVARAIHEHSRDPSLPFMPVNSAALPDTLLESELFGYVKGAFTGADRDREGIFARARGGTVFLDEIALMSTSFQGKLLRVLQEHTVVPLGSSTPRPVDFRLVAATNHSLREQIASGGFREDLYYRLRVVTIAVPPLRERPDDVLPLAEHFLALYAGQVGLSHRPRLTPKALEVLRSHTWPGNVRELENSVQRALVLCQGEDIDADHLSIEESGSWGASEVPELLTYEEGKKRTLEAYQRRTLERSLRSCDGNVSQAAELCGLSRAAFQRIMRSLGIDRARFVDEP